MDVREMKDGWIINMVFVALVVSLVANVVGLMAFNNLEAAYEREHEIYYGEVVDGLTAVPTVREIDSQLKITLHENTSNNYDACSLTVQIYYNNDYIIGAEVRFYSYSIGLHGEIILFESESCGNVEIMGGAHNGNFNLSHDEKRDMKVSNSDSTGWFKFLVKISNESYRFDAHYSPNSADTWGRDTPYLIWTAAERPPTLPATDEVDYELTDNGTIWAYFSNLTGYLEVRYIMNDTEIMRLEATINPLLDYGDPIPYMNVTGTCVANDIEPASNYFRCEDLTLTKFFYITGTLNNETISIFRGSAGDLYIQGGYI